jgi:hypothetical protein
MSAFQFLKSIAKMTIFGLYPEYKHTSINTFEKRVNICHSCEFCQTVKSQFKEVYFDDCCTKGLPNAENFDIYEHAKHENRKCPIDKW